MAPIRALFLHAFLVGPLLLFASLVASRHACYLPNGQPASGPTDACRLSDFDPPLAQCCHDGDLCLSNQLCGRQDPRGEFSYYRGTCTAKVWRNTEDGAGCMNPCPISYGNEETVPMHWCVEEDGTMSWYCGNDAPAGDKGCTRVGADIDLPDGIGVLATAGGTLTPAPVPTTLVETTLIETTSPSEGPSSTPSEINPIPTSSQPQPPPSTSNANNPSDSPPLTKDDDEEEDGSSAIPIGVGVAVGSLILMAGSALVYFYQRKRRREAPVRAETPPPFEFSFLNSQSQTPDWLGPAYGVPPPPPPPGPVHTMGGDGKMMPEAAGLGAGFGAGSGVPFSSSSMGMGNGMQNGMQHHRENMNTRMGPMGSAAEMRGSARHELP
ncbi:uncharacterized protein C8A04DRAFT_12986 [Dichotomopilus funicola]|uniref:Uncharacterized protein n=1 Tax=Dichotomopilus funicola TaxID=1934379 RepID=A0AAN6V0Q0_9PEZI|nr:hypothetical protein C8A04DRAFT_12986 [Dichotomopilus funicola]